MKRALFLTTYAPGKGSGANLVSLGRLKALAGLGYAITLLREGKGGLDRAALPAAVDEVIEVRGDRRRPGQLASDAASVLRKGWAPRWSAPVWGAVEEAAARSKPELTWLDGLFVADYGRRLKEAGLGGRIALQEHNVEHALLERRLAFAGGPLRRVELQSRIRRFRAWESSLGKHCDLALALTEEDRALLATANPGFPVHHLPPAVDMAHYARGGAGRPWPTELLFIGSCNWPPNLDGLTWFVEEIFPELRRRVPDARLHVVGRDPPAWLEGKEGVAVSGFVDDERAAYSTAAALVVPLRFGGGVRVKILNAFAMETPVISTPLGAEGITASDGEVLRLAADPAGFAAAAAQVLERPDEARRLAAAARALCTDRYGEGAIAARLGELLTRS